MSFKLDDGYPLSYVGETASFPRWKSILSFLFQSSKVFRLSMRSWQSRLGLTSIYPQCSHLQTDKFLSEACQTGYW